MIKNLENSGLRMVKNLKSRAGNINNINKQG